MDAAALIGEDIDTLRGLEKAERDRGRCDRLRFLRFLKEGRIAVVVHRRGTVGQFRG